MAHEISGFRDGTPAAAADLSANQFYAVKITAANSVNLAGAGEAAYGILQNKPKSGQACDVMVVGVTKAQAGAAISAGAKLMIDATGRVVTFSGSAKTVVGVAKETAAAAGEVISVYFSGLVGHVSP
ncbi:MAG: DUF2190 family protein [Alphaproteobacteria bacterium]